MRRTLALVVLGLAVVVATTTALVAVPGAWVALGLRSLARWLGDYGGTPARPFGAPTRTGAVVLPHAGTLPARPAVTDLAAWASWVQHEARLRAGEERWH